MLQVEEMAWDAVRVDLLIMMLHADAWLMTRNVVTCIAQLGASPRIKASQSS